MMVRIILGVLAGFVAWLIVWVGIELILSAMWPEYGEHQRAFQAAIEHGGQFRADTTFLLLQLVLASVVSVLSGFVAAMIARESRRAPLVLAVLVLAFGVLKVVLSWQYVAIWHHVILLALLFPMTLFGGRLKATAQA